MSKAIKQKMDKLAELIEYYNHKYFVEHESEIDDAVFDQLVRQLEFLEQKYPEYARGNSPTKFVGERFDTNTFESVKHKYPMLSLTKKFTVDELAEFAQKLFLGGTRDLTLEVKVDGLALSLYYEDGKFVRAVTRGNGVYGDDVTQTALAIQDFPKELPVPFNGEIRGEAYMKKSDFNNYNKVRELMGLKKYKNTRNLSSGLLKRKEVTEENTLLSFLAYAIFDEDNEYELYSEAMEKLEEWGFHTALLTPAKMYPDKVPPYRLYFEDKGFPFTALKDVLEDAINIWTEIREDLDFDIDGLVLKANKYSVQELFGMTEHSPNWATSYKFPAAEKVTTLLDVEWTMGNKGNITPNARIEPVDLMGVTISNITLHNLDELERLGIMIGDQIVVSRRGDVIPKVESVLTELRTGDEKPIKIPMQCPVDGAPTVVEGAFLRCSRGDECEYMNFAKIQNFVYAMEIEELGPILIEKLMKENIIKDLADLYDVKPEQIEVLERMGKRSANKVVNNIQASKEEPLFKVIAGLTIEKVSIQTAKDLANKYKSLEAFINCNVDELMTIDGIGPKTAMNIYQWCQKEKNRNLVYKLIERKVGKYEEQELLSDKLDGKVFCFTGKMVHYKRNELEQMVIDNGGFIGGVNKKLNYLVVGEKPGSKLEKAKSIGTIKIITEQEFLDMLK